MAEDLIEGCKKTLAAFFLPVSLVVFLCLPSFVSAQKLPGFSGQKGSEVSTSVQLSLPATTEEIDAAISQAESRLADLRGQMNAAVAADAEKTGPEVATSEELKERDRLIGRRVTVADTRVQSLRDLKDIRVMARDHTAEMRGWHGFTEKPPFPIAFLDGLRDAILGQKLDLKTLELRHGVAKSQLQEFTAGLKKTRAELRLAEENLGKSLGSPAEARQRWLLDLARLRNDLNEAGAASAETRRLVLDEALKDRREYLRFVERKLAIAEKSSPLSQADFTRKIQELENQRKSLDRELDAAIRADGDAKEKLRKERDALEKELAKIRPGEISLILLFDRSIKAGDIVEVDGQAGRVVSVGLRSSHIMGFDGVEWLVPNSHFLQQKVTNWTLSVTIRRYSISVGVAYGSPTHEVSRLISKAVEESASVLKDPAPVVLFENFADSALTFSVYFWLDLFSTMENRVVLSDLRHHIVEILDGAGIVIAFPQRDIHLDSAKPIEIKMVTERREG